MRTLARQRALDAIKPGDLVYGMGEGGQPKLLLVLSADNSGFVARHITTGMELKFGRDGVSKPLQDGGTCSLISTATLPPDWRKTAIALERKMRIGVEPGDPKLSAEEIKLLLSIKAYYKARPLPDE